MGLQVMPINPPSAKYCIFTELDHAIWEFRFLKATPQAVDEWVAWQNYLRNLPPNPPVTTVRTLLDFRPDGIIPMMYALQKNFEWRSRNQDIQSIPVKVAIVIRSMNRIHKTYLELAKDGVNAFGMHKVTLELFSDTYDEALDWLIQE